MTASSSSFHEDPATLSSQTRDFHRAIVSLMEELEAVDWYGQRIDAAEDPDLREILAHNRDEEIEHAAMILEWLRRHDPKFDEELRGRLLRPGPIVGADHGEDAGGDGDGGARDLGIGSLRGAEVRP